MYTLLSNIQFNVTRFLQAVFVRSSHFTEVKLSFTHSDIEMAIWCFSKTVFGTTIASAAFIYCIIILHNRKEKKETDSKLKCVYNSN